MLRMMLFALLGFFASATAAQAQTVRHQLEVTLDPVSHRIEVIDQISLPTTEQAETIFLLHENLKIIDAPLSIKPLNAPAALQAYQATMPVPVKAYVIKQGVETLTLNYAGVINHSLAEQGEEYARSFGETPGVIAPQGVFLAATSAWYPIVENTLVSFSMQVSLPPGWKAVSQGQRIDADKSQGWSEPGPQQEIYLIAAEYSEYSKSTGAVEAMAFLRQPDQALANKYLDVTAQYIEMYRKLIGPYPYKKFALVENFWETGYGMPSFTLLGPKVIRLPFILHSSYPHEILHNWWGNGVYVDYQQGNWAEGLTSYLADHLIKEQRGSAAGFRRNILQGYADFVSAGKDFPLAQFSSRHSSSSQAVGYGKAQMLFHMLRRTLGDEAFVKGLHQLYRQYKFKEAGFSELKAVFENASDKTLDVFFQQWTQRSGAPEIKLDSLRHTKTDKGWRLVGELQQVQNEAAYQLTIPLAVTLEGYDKAQQFEVTMTDKAQAFELELKAKPLRVDVDPEFDLFRRVSRAEIPAALSQLYGAERALIVLPSKASADIKQAYAGLAQNWSQTQSSRFEVKYDDEIKTLPDDHAIWVLGEENYFAVDVKELLKEQSADYQAMFKPAQQSVVVTLRKQPNDEHALGWVTADRVAAVAGLARKLPHYGKYSYLAFKGDEPTNVIKGQWPVTASPLTRVFDGKAVDAAALAPRMALAQLPPVFNSQRMMADVNALSAAEMEGRGLGGKGIDKAADYIANEFRKAGLQPGLLSSNRYFQEWDQRIDGLDKTITLKNVVAVIPGINPALAGQSVVIGAHYDHLGFGWPDVRAGNEGKLHAGADDNASGVAVLLELARLAAESWQPERSVVFVAFSAEEAGRLGSHYFVNHYSPLPANKVMAMINLDTVGRLGDAPITAFGTGSAREWVHIFRGVGFVTGLSVKAVADDFGSSDQRSYLDVGVPAVQLFATVHSDFHAPGDSPDKVDSVGLVKVASVLKETVEYLSNRHEPLAVTLTTTSAPSKVASQKQGRKVSMGTVPDFAYSGKGVLVSDVVTGSAAESAGLKAGDVIVVMDGDEVNNLADMARLMRAMQPGQTVEVGFVRQGKTERVNITLGQR